MAEVPTEPIKPPAHQDVKASAAGVGQESIERGASVLRAAHPAVDVLGRLPCTGLHISAQFLELILWLLVVETRDAGATSVSDASCRSSG